MKKILSISLLLAVILFGKLSAQIQHFTWQGVEREYLVRTPANHNGTLPVLFFLHGLGDNISNYDQGFNFAQIAEEYHWMIVLPQALDQGIGTMWNAGLASSSIDDSGFLMALLDSLTVQYQLDTDSVFFAGMSMGGFMTHRMAIEHGDRIAACVAVSGLISSVDAAQTPVAPVRMLHIHGTNDNVVGYNGYSTAFGMNLGLGVDAIMDYWQNANGCSGEPTIDTLPDLKNDGLRFIRYTYNCGTDLQHLKVVGGTHTWYLNANQYDVSYNDIIYDFFTGHNNTSEIPNRKTDHFQIWPNPTDGILHIQTSGPQLSHPEIRIYDVHGKILDVVETMCTSLPQTIRIDISHYPNGVYFVQVGDGAMTKVIKRQN
ncbi:MAG: T9SS type A sorting domain-containing protein [Bacteroidales bacterium]|nr:T9SS type A sorting domain-containing protein [Bacteroidales bacterium]